ncbi:MAG: flagellar motor protein MotB [Planctomycetota bacterium]
MPKKKKKGGDEIPEWVVTYGDLMSLLLCFFILLAAFSELKKPREYQRVVDAIQDELGVAGGVGYIEVPANPRQTMVMPVIREAQNVSEQKSRAKQNEPNIEGRDAAVTKVHEGTWFRVGRPITFEPGSVQLTERAMRIIDEEIAPKLVGIRDITLIRGHAAPEADAAGVLGPDELAYERARAVYERLVREGGVSDLILRVESAGAFEPSVPDPMAAGGSQAAGENRRVDVVRTEATLEEVHPDPSGTGRAGG